MLLDHSLKALHWLRKERQLSLARQVKQRIEFTLVFESNPEMAGIRLRVKINSVGEMADQLVSKEVKCNAILITPCQLAAKSGYIKIEGRVQITAGNRQMKYIVGVTHKLPSFTVSTAPRATHYNSGSPIGLGHKQQSICAQP
jgi:hypothetical protein